MADAVDISLSFTPSKVLEISTVFVLIKNNIFKLLAESSKAEEMFKKLCWTRQLFDDGIMLMI